MVLSTSTATGTVTREVLAVLLANSGWVGKQSQNATSQTELDESITLAP